MSHFENTAALNSFLYFYPLEDSFADIMRWCVNSSSELGHISMTMINLFLRNDECNFNAASI